MNVKLLEKVKERILAEPLDFDMSAYADQDENAPCGTTGCIAGWAVLLKHFPRSAPDAKKWWRKAHELTRTTKPTANEEDSLGPGGIAGRLALELAVDEAQRLFYVGYWPGQFRTPYREIEDKIGRALFLDKPIRALARRRAKIAAQRIDHFIKTEGRE